LHCFRTINSSAVQDAFHLKRYNIRQASCNTLCAATVASTIKSAMYSIHASSTSNDSALMPSPRITSSPCADKWTGSRALESFRNSRKSVCRHPQHKLSLAHLGQQLTHVCATLVFCRRQGATDAGESVVSASMGSHNMTAPTVECPSAKACCDVLKLLAIKADATPAILNDSSLLQR